MRGGAQFARNTLGSEPLCRTILQAHSNLILRELEAMVQLLQLG